MYMQFYFDKVYYNIHVYANVVLFFYTLKIIFQNKNLDIQVEDLPWNPQLTIDNCIDDEPTVISMQ